MPINVYTGLMRSGKSYEVVSQVILDAVVQGRRVVTNVDGIDSDLIREHVAGKTGKDIEALGLVVHCSNEDVFSQRFFPYYDDKKSSITDTFCQPGDLVCIDEAWRFWGTDCKILKEHKSFFLEHGHFVHPESKVACDLVLMIQDISTLHRFLRSVVAFSFRTHKKVSLGLSNTYSVNMWEGSKMTRATMIGTWVRKYDKAVFPLYSSFKGGEQGKTVDVDKRQNILGSKKLLAMGLAVLLLGGFGIWGVKRFFDGPKPKGKASELAQSASGAASAAAITHASGPAMSETWRVSGSMRVGERQYVVLVGEGGRVRLEHPSSFQNVGAVMVGDIDGERVSTWSGATASALPELKK